MNRVQRYFYRLFKRVLYPYVRIFQRVKYNYNGLEKPKEQTLFISNHHSNWDPVWLCLMFVRKNIHFLASEEIFKNKFYSLVFAGILEEVKRAENSASVSDVMDVIRMKQKGYDIGIYPEGDIDFFGELMNHNLAIAKLIKLLKLPVAILRVDGAFTRMPRWNNNKARHSKIVYNYVRYLSVEEIEKLSVEELDYIIWSGIKTNEEQYQQINNIKQRKGHLAEWLETGIFYCPKCQSYETLNSDGDVFACSKCHHQVKLTPEGKFVSLDNSEVVYETPYAWNRAQLANLKERVKKLLPGEILLERKNIPMFWSKYNTKFSDEKPEMVSIKLRSDGLIVELLSGEKRIIPLTFIYKVWVYHKEVLEIFTSDYRVRFNQDDLHWCAYLYVKAIELLKENVSQPA
jgi:1-acyl-sn-glycerol-3-phosphate acyltransferase